MFHTTDARRKLLQVCPQVATSQSKRVVMTSQWAAAVARLRRFTTSRNIPELPRSLPTEGYEIIDPELLVEEEEIPNYRADRFYPVKLGQVFEDRYQVLAKLGFGSSSTTWLARDLMQHQYVALKICVHTSRVHRELPVYERITQRMAHAPQSGQANIRSLLGSFTASGPHGKHVVLVQQPAQLSLLDMKAVFFKDGFAEHFARSATIELLKAIDFLHSQAEIVHTVPRKHVSAERTIYMSRATKPKVGPMLFSDFGEARTGAGPHGGDIMPLEYRAPEVLACIAWSYPVDIWSVALCAWDLLHPTRLFTARDDDGDLYDAAHLAQIIAAIGLPPEQFYKRNQKYTIDFWDENGTWTNLAPIPKERTLEALETKLQDPSDFLRFLRRALVWLPEERPTAKELHEDPWLLGGDQI